MPAMSGPPSVSLPVIRVPHAVPNAIPLPARPAA